MAQMTAVEFLFKQYKLTDIISNSQWDKARRMEKEQIMKAVDIGFDEGCKFPEDISLKNAEQYYNDTYKQNT